MRLCELINFEPITTKRYSHDTYDKLKKATPNELGKGEYASVRDINSDKRKKQVLKLSKPADVFDSANIAYLKTVNDLKNKGINNAYFPIIHDLKIYKDPLGDLQANIKLEKLLDYDTVVESYPGKIEEIKKAMFVDPGVGKIPDILDSYIMNGPHNNIKDKELKYALDVICNILKNDDGFIPDIHHKNIMWRATGGKLQLVITDPIA
jgi:hypothetical protein